MGVPGGTRGSIFTPVPCEIKSYEPEAIASRLSFFYMLVSFVLSFKQTSLQASIRVSLLCLVQTFARNKGGSKKPTSLLSGVQHVSR